MRGRYNILEAEFVAGGQTADALPNSPLPEFAFTGRSNVGKSTLLNRLVNRHRLARTSRTPGCTQQINIFEILLAGHKAKDTRLHLADLPGFGFARLSKSELERIRQETIAYLENRDTLKGLCLLSDARRDVQEDEIELRNVAMDLGIHVLPVITKSDELKKSELPQRLEAIADAYGLESSDLIVMGEGISIDPLWKAMLTLL